MLIHPRLLDSSARFTYLKRFVPCGVGMVVFGNEVRLCAVNSSEFLGLSGGRDANELLITNGHNTVIVYEVAPQKASSDFSTLRGHSLTCSVIYSAKQNRYVSALKNLNLRVWTVEDQAHTGKGRKISVPHEVHSLWNPGPEVDPVVIFKNGAVCQLDSSNQLKFLVQPINEIVSLISARLTLDKIRLAYVTTTRKGMRCHYVVFQNGQSDQPVSRFVGPLPNNIIAIPKGLCIPEEDTDKSMQIMLLGNDGEFMSGELDLSKKRIAWKTYYKMPDLENENLMTMEYCNGHFVLAQQYQTGVINCIALSLKYRMETHKMSMTAERKEKLKLYVVNNRLYLMAGEELFFIPFAKKSADLSQLIGCKTSKRISTGNRIDKMSWTSKGLKTEEIITSDLKVQKLSRAVLELVHESEESLTSENVDCAEVFMKLIDGKKLYAIEEALSYYENVPEDILVNILSAYLCSDDDCSRRLGVYRYKKNQDKATHHPLIELIISKSINNVFLEEQLRRLTVDEAIFLLQYLYRILKNIHFISEKNWAKITQYVEWISMLLDAHFHHIVILRNARLDTFLRQLMSIVTEQCEYLENLAAVQGLIWIAKCKSSDVDTWKNACYCIESLEF